METKLCRTCETEVEVLIFKEHTKFCKVKTDFDVKCIRIDDQIRKLLLEVHKCKPSEPEKVIQFNKLVHIIEKIANSGNGVEGSSDCAIALHKISAISEQLKPLSEDLAKLLSTAISLVCFA